MESHTAGMDNPLQKLVNDACTPDEPDADGTDLYLEYGGFKFAADENPELYTDFDPTVNQNGAATAAAGASDDEGGYLEKEGADGDGVDGAADDYVPPGDLADDGYLEQQAQGAVAADEDGYLEQQAPTDVVGADADDYVPAVISPETAYGEPTAAEDGAAADLGDAGYLEQQAAADGAAVDADADDYVPEEPADLGDAGYLEQQAAADGAAVDADADDYVPETTVEA
jgi:hypothetical protein